MKTCSTIRGSFLQFNQTTSQKRAETAIIITNNNNNKHNSNTTIISNLTNLTTNDTHQPLLFDRKESHSRPPLPRMFKTVLTRNSMPQNPTRHSCSRLKGHYLRGHLQTSKAMYVQYRKLCYSFTQSGQSGSAITYSSWKLRLPGHLQASKLLYVQYRKICNLFTQSGQSGTAITYSWESRPQAHSTANHQHVVCSNSHYLPFNHPIGSKRICHLVILLEIETTNSTANFQNCCSISHHLHSNHPIGPKRICHLSILLPETNETTTKSTANFQNVVCSPSHNLLLNHPIGPKQICLHSIRLEIEPATSHNAVCSISQTLLLIHPIGPKRIAITYSWRPRPLLDTLARIFNNPNKEETPTIQRQSGDGGCGCGFADKKDKDADYDEDEALDRLN
jgi:hypothetical protein